MDGGQLGHCGDVGFLVGHVDGGRREVVNGFFVVIGLNVPPGNEPDIAGCVGAA